MNYRNLVLLCAAFGVLAMNAAYATGLSSNPTNGIFSWTPGNVIDVGQGATANTFISGGNPPYTGNWVWTIASGNTLTLGNTVKATPLIG